MLSRTSFFNKTLYRKNLSRFWPLWGMASFGAAIFPLALLVQLTQGYDSVKPLEMTHTYYEVAVHAAPIFTLIYAVLCAMMVWSYLYNARSVGTMHTLPIRREGLFVTNLLSGLTMLLFPYVTAGVLCILISIPFGFFEPVGVAVTILAILGESLLYFGSATLVAFITGNVFALPALYFIFHFLAVVLDTLISNLARGFFFGVTTGYTGVVEWLSPTVFLMSRLDVETTRIYVDQFGRQVEPSEEWFESVLTSVTLQNSWIIAVYALVGAVCIALAWLLYRRRRSESAGDVVSVGWMKPVFRWGVTACAALVGGMTFYTIFWSPLQQGSFTDPIPMVLCLALGGAIGYYAAGMLLSKSFRVFRGSWKGLAAMILACAALVAVLQTDLLGVERRVPEAGAIQELELRVAGNSYYLHPGEDDALIEEVRKLHQSVIADRDYVESMEQHGSLARPYDEEEQRNTSWSNSLRLTYTLRGGVEIERRYYLPVTRDRLAQEGTYDRLMNDLVNGRTMRERRLHIGDADLRPSITYIYSEVSGKDTNLNREESAQLLAALEQDVAAGTWGEYDWFNNNDAYCYAIDVNIEFMGEQTDAYGNREYDHLSVNVNPAMTNTVRYLLEQGCVTEKGLKTYRELYPERYEDTEWIQYEKYLQERIETETIVTYGPGAVDASIGVIGGADGPTAVFVS